MGGMALAPTPSPSAGRPFIKMNGLGNDFVVVDTRRSTAFRPEAIDIQRLADRASGIGFDQLIALEPTSDGDVFMRIWNADGGEVAACGNATRCVGGLILNELARDEVRILTDAGLLIASRADEGQVSVDMGRPRVDWRDIPLAEEMDTRGIELQVGPIDAPLLHTPGCVNMGNPHVVFFVKDAAAAPVQQVGPMLEHHPLFPDRVNVGFAEIRGPREIRFRVWERGAGETRACGTGACAALVAAHRRLLTERSAKVVLDGGDLQIDWRLADDHVIMTGAYSLEYEGRLP